jgi:hypothetical protein
VQFEDAPRVGPIPGLPHRILDAAVDGVGHLLEDRQEQLPPRRPSWPR